MSIQKIQNDLIKDVIEKTWMFIELKWANNMGSIRVYTRKCDLFQTINNLSKNYTSYWKREYKPECIIIKQIQNKNPHIKLEASIHHNLKAYTII